MAAAVAHREYSEVPVSVLTEDVKRPSGALANCGGSCSCAEGDGGPGFEPIGREASPFEFESAVRPARERDQGLVSFSAQLDHPMVGAPLRIGEVWHLVPEDGKSFEPSAITLYQNGMRIESRDSRPAISTAWSPFSLVQACRLHSMKADAALSWLRLFKVSIFQHGSTHFFATQGDDADTERARWVADISRSLRQLTQSLFPDFVLAAHPLVGADWTATRLLAGYLLLCDDQGVSLVYCELHSHWNCAATFAAYEDELCDTQVVRLGIDMHTCVSERVGVDCSCFSFDGYHFTTRTCAEKMLWLRALSNVKVKLRHRAPNPTPEELWNWREAIVDYVKVMRTPPTTSPVALLPQRTPRRGHRPQHVTERVIHGPAGPNPTGPFGMIGQAPGAQVDQTTDDPIATSLQGPAARVSKLQIMPTPHKLSAVVSDLMQAPDDLPQPSPSIVLPSSQMMPRPPSAINAMPPVSPTAFREDSSRGLMGPVPALPTPPALSMPEGSDTVDGDLGISGAPFGQFGLPDSFGRPPVSTAPTSPKPPSLDGVEEPKMPRTPREATLKPAFQVSGPRKMPSPREHQAPFDDGRLKKRPPT
eukprot:TRINITY_DN10297_c0_g4_i1.p1 TRINITY_DN10297_c0_g4~~TRINITY_DN10297_c0_g4_i1.p1  ORF type:complete len:590 (-),score=85.93 TRINITY_DN10297_c0_g4_i1:93-1862(-)